MSGLREWSKGLRETMTTKPIGDDQEERFTVRDSTDVLKEGCEVQEMTTVPAELMDLFK